MKANRIIPMLMAGFLIVLAVTLFGGGTALASIFSGGTGTADDPYQITDAEQLDYIRNYLGSCYILMNDIDLTAYLSEGGAGYNDGAGWVPVGGTWNDGGFYTDAFDGKFDGQNYKITGLTINSSSGCIGLFGFVSYSGVIKNLGLEGVNVQNTAASGTYSYTGTGSLAGVNQGKIIDCYATGSVTGNDNIGGLVGYNDSMTAKIYHSDATCSVTGTAATTGGLVGYNSNTSSITCCKATGSPLVGNNQGFITDYTVSSWNLPVYRGYQWKANGSDYDIRFIATIDILDPDSVGFVYSNTNYEPTIEDSEKVDTTTVYTSILENGNQKVAARMGGNYIMACPVTLPGTWSGNPFYIRAYSRCGTETTYTSMFEIYAP